MIPCSVCKKPVLRKLMKDHLSNCLARIRALTTEYEWPEFSSSAYTSADGYDDAGAKQEWGMHPKPTKPPASEKLPASRKADNCKLRPPSPQTAWSSDGPFENSAYFHEMAELHETSSLQVEVVCSYCKEVQRFDNVMKHMESLCPKRPISCVFCKAYISAYKQPMHEANCDQRPGRCPHCKTDFRTMLELEEKHYPECLQMPVTCAFREMGCEFTARRQEMVEHERNGNHAELLVKEIACLKRDLKALMKRNKATPKFMPTYQHTWTLHPFTYLKHATSAGTRCTISSGVLTVNTPGYRIELVINLNGKSEQRAVLGCSSSKSSRDSPAYLSLNFRLHPGEHDDILPWPFANKIRIVLVNHVNEECKQEFEFDPVTGDAAEECFRKPSVGRPNTMFGFPRLIPISLLEAENSEFVSHNSVVFQFVVLPL